MLPGAQPRTRVSEGRSPGTYGHRCSLGITLRTGDERGGGGSAVRGPVAGVSGRSESIEFGPGNDGKESRKRQKVRSYILIDRAGTVPRWLVAKV